MSFNTKMKVPENTANFIEPILDSEKSQDERRLQESVIRVVLKPSEENENDPGYKGATLKAFEPLKMEIQLNFEDPGVVSFDTIADRLKIEITNPAKFVSVQGETLDSSSTNFEKELPRQISKDAVVVEIEQATDAALATMVVSAIAMHPLIQVVLNNLLSMIEPLTSISHFVLHRLNYPANLADFFSQLLPLITFDMIPEEVMDAIF